MKNRKRRAVEPRLGIECLESRALLAGNVTVAVNAEGDLSIKGDKEGNCVEVQQFDTDADTFVDTTEVSGCVGFDDTTINGGPGPFVTGLIGRDLKVDMKKGDDGVFLGSDSMMPTTGVLVPRNLSVKTDDGSDFVAVIAEVGGKTSIETGKDDDFVRILGSEFFGTVDVQTKQGDDEVLVGFSVFHDKFTLGMDGGDFDFFCPAVSTFEAAVELNGGKGDDDLTDLTTNTFAFAPVVKGFETVVGP